MDQAEKNAPEPERPGAKLNYLRRVKRVGSASRKIVALIGHQVANLAWLLVTQSGINHVQRVGFRILLHVSIP